MKKFYENLLLKEMSKLDALRNAQHWLLRNPSELEKLGVSKVRGQPRDLGPLVRPIPESSQTAPYFWAAFGLSGAR